MSSHHIVRDEQEPALFLHHTNHAHWPVIQQLLEWSPIVVSSEQPLEEIISFGHKVDIALLTPFEKEHWNDKLEMQKPVEIYEITGHEIVFSSFSILKSRKAKTINIVTNNESLFSVLDEATKWTSSFDIVVITEDQRHILCKSMLFKKWLPAFSNLVILPLTPLSYATTEGFDLNLDNELLREGIELTKKQEGEISIKMSALPYLISELIH